MQLKDQAKALALGLVLSAATTAPALAQEPTESARRNAAVPASAKQTQSSSYYTPQKAKVSARKATTRKQAEQPPMPPSSPPPEVYEMEGLDTIETGSMIETGSGCCGTHGRSNWWNRRKSRPTFCERVHYKWKNYWKPGLQEHHWGYPEEFGEKPLGYFVYGHMRTMVANGEASRMVLYEYDFHENKRGLTSRGLLQLERIAYMSPRNFFPIIVERSSPSNPQLDEARREAVLEALAQGNFPVPPERVLVGRPQAHGLPGDQSETLYTNQGQSIQQRGAFPAPDIRAGIGTQ